MRYFQTELFVGHVNLAAGSIVSSCQTGKMGALLNSLFVVFKISFLANIAGYFINVSFKYINHVTVAMCNSVKRLVRPLRTCPKNARHGKDDELEFFQDGEVQQ